MRDLEKELERDRRKLYWYIVLIPRNECDTGNTRSINCESNIRDETSCRDRNKGKVRVGEIHRTRVEIHKEINDGGTERKL
jgi:hypothetical protein